VDTNQIFERVRACVAESLALPEGEVEEASRLIDDLGADSLDFLDIIFGLETAFSIKLRDPGLDLVTRGEFPEAGGGEGRYLTADEITRLEAWLPALRTASDRNRISPRGLYSYITVESLVLMVERKLAS
jgi:acyl carrier protein